MVEGAVHPPDPGSGNPKAMVALLKFLADPVRWVAATTYRTKLAGR